ncbi:hypothetical protein GCM10007415_00820 [Parapedobacter pyrenivorans]|uniref:exo-alpha-sialidase n=1 Tax=Parapedobacter pyrenivorans TaxID=1305674 RepID=A0A917HB72_9SPHI|nr:sialidase family protein [Parapedobacter pyrenivorans]GGG73285.1 hypothetical protein GCM10007415_00820 [Parapedobacter pyrenivorans]
MYSKGVFFSAILRAIVVFLLLGGGITPAQDNSRSVLTKLKDFVIYKDTAFYSSFPSVIRKKNGELFIAFRRAPNRVLYGRKSNIHIDPNACLVSVRSIDGGATWSEKPKLLFAHPFGGSQDPCLLPLSDGSILCASFLWSYVGGDTLRMPWFDKNSFRDDHALSGGYITKSYDGGDHWVQLNDPPTIPLEPRLTPTGKPLPAYNRGALLEHKSGRMFWAVTGKVPDIDSPNSVHLLASDDGGETWDYQSEIASDEKIVFNETSLYETPTGRIVAFMRTSNHADQACMAVSEDGGKSFGSWTSMGFKGHPLQALRLPDNRVLLVYGYRHKPYGIRARVLDAECTDYMESEEFVIRDDGGTPDLGYPWSVMLDGNNVLVVYYFNNKNGIRYIGGSILEVQ